MTTSTSPLTSARICAVATTTRTSPSLSAKHAATPAGTVHRGQTAPSVMKWEIIGNWSMGLPVSVWTATMKTLPPPSVCRALTSWWIAWFAFTTPPTTPRTVTAMSSDASNVRRAYSWMELRVCLLLTVRRWRSSTRPLICASRACSMAVSTAPPTPCATNATRGATTSWMKPLCSVTIALLSAVTSAPPLIRAQCARRPSPFMRARASAWRGHTSTKGKRRVSPVLPSAYTARGQLPSSALSASRSRTES